MFDTIFGLPLHVLANHVAVVSIPVAALLTVAVSARPVWRERWAGWVALVDAGVLVIAYVTRQSGQELFKRLDSLDAAGVAEAHRSWGLFIIWPVLVLFVVSVLVWIGTRQAMSPLVSNILTVVALVAAGVVVYYVIRTGDSGARAVWEDIVRSTD